MTAARSDLMALAWRLREAAYFCTKLEDLEDHCKQVATELDRLAASQPDREAVARFVRMVGALLVHINPTDVAEDFSQQWQAVQHERDCILSLLSGAGTKSDGGGQ